MSQRMQRYLEDEVIIGEGQETTAIYKIVTGKVLTYMHYGQENEYIVGVLSEKQFFGELGFLAKIPSPYTYVAMEDAVLLAVTEEEFEDFIIHNTKNTIDIMKQMAGNIAKLNRHVDILGKELEHIVDSGKEMSEAEVQDIRGRLRFYQNGGIERALAESFGQQKNDSVSSDRIDRRI